MKYTRLMLRMLLFVASVIPAQSFSQTVITGRVSNMSGNKPLANASVFLSNATIGDKTADDGTFTLRNARPGKYQLVVSIVGFETYTQAIMVSAGDTRLPDIPMISKTFLLNEVKIKPQYEKYRDQYYALFEDNFLGRSELTKDCRIVNPKIIDFDYDDKTSTLKASSADFLVIENKALGYTVKYLLSDFMLNTSSVTDKRISYKGFVLFEEMKGSAQQKKQWQKARAEVYANSSVHFFRALVDHQLEAEGFRVQQLSTYYNPERPADTLITSKLKFYNGLNSKSGSVRDSLAYWIKKSKIKNNLLKLNTFSLDVNEIVQPTTQPGIYALGCDNDALYVTYNKYGHFGAKGYIANVDDKYNSENTIITFGSAYTYFDSNGWVSNPESVVYSGVWAKSRVAELLPEDYEPVKTRIGAADTGLSAMVSKMSKYATTHVTEKLYLHLDKTSYIPGDTLWLKAYTVTNPAHSLSNLSNIAHVELWNNKDSLISRLALPLSSGIGWGDIALPPTLRNGNYQLRAYTNWMRNAGTDYFFNQQIAIGDVSPIKAKKQNVLSRPDVQFMAEGGALVNGLRSKVAVKSVNEKGQGEDIEGTVTDNENNEVADFKTQHLGMGVFALTPLPGKTYKAKITPKNGSPYTIDLPKAQDDGFTITINNTQADSIGVRIVTSNTFFASKKNAVYYLLALSDGKVCYTAVFKLSAQSFNANIDKKRFPTGIARFTLFGANNEPLNERIAFIQNYDDLKLTITTPGKTFAPREKVKIKLQAATADDHKTTGSFSVSVVNESFAPADEMSENTILNNLLLTSDIKGHIDQPNYYFTNTTDKTRADLDILMLTQGYHRFEWKQVLANSSQSPAFEPEKSLQLSGIVKTLDGKPVANAKVRLLSNKTGIFVVDTVTSQDGKFSFDRLPEDSARYVIQARTEKDKKNVTIMLDTLMGYKALATINTPFGLDTLKQITAYQQQVNQQRKLSLDKRLIQLKEVVIRDKKEPENDPFSHASQPDQVVKDFPKESAMGLKTFLANKLRNVVLMDPDNDHIFEFYSTRSMAKDIKHVKPLMVKLDGSVITADLFDSMLLTDVESAELITTSGKMDMATGANDVLYLISRTRGGGASPSTPDVITYQSNGLYKAREFYSPKYDKVNESTTKPDLRTTIYWSPAILTDKGVASFEYFNGDIKGTYRVTVEGIDADGNLGRQVYRYNVE